MLVPIPRVDSSAIVPPINLTSCNPQNMLARDSLDIIMPVATFLAMTNPSPLPPYSRAVELSACLSSEH